MVRYRCGPQHDSTTLKHAVLDSASMVHHHTLSAVRPQPWMPSPLFSHSFGSCKVRVEHPGFILWILSAQPWRDARRRSALLAVCFIFPSMEDPALLLSSFLPHRRTRSRISRTTYWRLGPESPGYARGQPPWLSSGTPRTPPGSQVGGIGMTVWNQT